MSTVPLLIGAAAATVIAVVLLWFSPRSTFAVWVGAAFFIPPWVGVTVGIAWSALTAVTILALVLHFRSMHWTAADVAMIAFVLLIVMLWAVGTIPLTYLVIAFLGWLLPYLWGRAVLKRVPAAVLIDVIAIAATIAAALAVIESLTGVNWFSSIPGSGIDYDTWSPLQLRGGETRAEGAFGHSIALGAVLAMSSAFVIATKWAIPIRVGSLAIVTLATVLTLSRTGLITLGLTVAIAIFLMRGLSLRNRLIFLGLLGVAGAVAVSFLSDAFSDASDELAGSADYRTDLTVLLSQVRVFGAAPDWESLVVGDYYLGHFARSVDSTVVLTLLRYGLVATLFAFSVIVFAIWSSFRKSSQRNPAGIAVAAQLPSLFVVSLITQYGAIFWFFTGLAIAWSAHLSDDPQSFSRGAAEDHPHDLKQGANVVTDGPDDHRDTERYGGAE